MSLVAFVFLIRSDVVTLSERCALQLTESVQEVHLFTKT